MPGPATAGLFPSLNAMPNPLKQSIASAVRANEKIGASFARFGTSDHPRGFMLAAYRNAHRAMSSALAEPNRLVAALEVMRGLRTSVLADVRGEFRDMQDLGQAEAARQLRYYGITRGPAFSNVRSGDLDLQLTSAVDAVMAQLDAQEASIRALILTDAEDEQIIGDEHRAGVLLPGAVLSAGIYWTAALTWSAFSYFSSQQNTYKFQKQAIAALDARTTDCCLRVHAQVQPFDKPFILTGTPRYADKVDWPAFHWYCRTSGCLYVPEFDEGLSAAMRAGADQVLLEQSQGKSGDRHPADAFG